LSSKNSKVFFFFFGGSAWSIGPVKDTSSDFSFFFHHN
jgi:hypothetical protein